MIGIYSNIQLSNDGSMYVVGTMNTGYSTSTPVTGGSITLYGSIIGDNTGGITVSQQTPPSFCTTSAAITTTLAPAITTTAAAITTAATTLAPTPGPALLTTNATITNAGPYLNGFNVSAGATVTWSVASDCTAVFSGPIVIYGSLVLAQCMSIGSSLTIASGGTLFVSCTYAGPNAACLNITSTGTLVCNQADSQTRCLIIDTPVYIGIYTNGDVTVTGGIDILPAVVAIGFFVASGATLNVYGYVNGAQNTDIGTGLSVQSGGTVNIIGRLVLNASYAVLFFPPCEINVYGSINVVAESAGAISSNGTINLYGNRIGNTNQYISVLPALPALLTANATITNAGPYINGFNVSAGATATWSPVLQPPITGPVIIYGSLILAQSATIGSSLTIASGGTLFVSCTDTAAACLTITDAGTLVCNQADTQAPCLVIDAAGTGIDMHGSATVAGGIDIRAPASRRRDAAPVGGIGIMVAPGTVLVVIGYINLGTSLAVDGTVTVFGSLVVGAAGSITIGPLGQFTVHGSITGVGVIAISTAGSNLVLYGVLVGSSPFISVAPADAPALDTPTIAGIAAGAVLLVALVAAFAAVARKGAPRHTPAEGRPLINFNWVI